MTEQIIVVARVPAQNSRTNTVDTTPSGNAYLHTEGGAQALHCTTHTRRLFYNTFDEWPMTLILLSQELGDVVVC